MEEKQRRGSTRERLLVGNDHENGYSYKKMNFL